MIGDSNFRNNVKKKKPFADGGFSISHFRDNPIGQNESLLLYISSHVYPFQQRTISHMHDLGKDF